jgi:hypothetical protein
MDKLEKIYTGIFIGVLFIAIIIFIHYYNKKDNEISDLNNDGVISESEIEYHIKKELDKRSNRPPKFRGIVKSSISGFLRGTLMGLILNGLEGALTSGIVLAVVNPIITGLEPML